MSILHHRHSIRYKEFDYSRPGFYFITLCVKDRVCLFGRIIKGLMELNEAGIMVENEWIAMTNRFPHVQLHNYIIMPNHFHAILEITVGATLVVAPNDGVIQNIMGNHDQNGATTRVAPTRTLGDMVGAFKSIVTVKYIQGVNNRGWVSFDDKLWQRNYYEHIIRDKKSYRHISDYIVNNPSNWDDDKFFHNG